jgi:20S proteasome alpha/beta subunit
MQEESKNVKIDKIQSCSRVFAVVLRGDAADFQQWLESAKVYGLYVIFSKSSRTSKLVIKEEGW